MDSINRTVREGIIGVRVIRACSVLSPRVLGMATNQIFDGIKTAMENGTAFSINFTTMGTILLVLIELYTLGTLFNYIPQRLLASVSQKLTLDLRKRISEKLNKLPLRYFDTHKKGEILSRVTNDLERVADSVQETIGQFGYVLIAVRGAVAVINGNIRIGDVQAAFQYVNQISEPITQLSYTMNNLQGALASAERVYDLLDELEEIPDTVSSRLLPAPKGNVTFKNVQFGYTSDKMLMEKINIEVRAGSKVAIVGPTGAGKTTRENISNYLKKMVSMLNYITVNLHRKLLDRKIIY